MGVGLSEPATITALGQFLPPGATLFVGASMPIRDLAGRASNHIQSRAMEWFHIGFGLYCILGLLIPH